MTRSTYRLGLSLAVVGLTLSGLAACGNDPPTGDPTKTPDPTPTQTATAEPTDTGPVEPELPEAAKKPGRKGAEAFVQHYWDAIQYAQETGDTGPLRLTGTRTCEPCKIAIRVSEDHRKKKETVEGGETTTTPIETKRTSRTDFADNWRATVTMENKKQVIRDSTGKVLRRFPAGEVVGAYYLQWRASAWLITTWSVLQ